MHGTQKMGGQEGLSQAPQRQDLVNVKPHPVVSPRDGAAAGALLLLLALMLLRDKDPDSQHWVQAPHLFPSCLLKDPNPLLFTFWIQGHSPFNAIFPSSFKALALFPGARAPGASCELWDSGVSTDPLTLQTAAETMSQVGLVCVWEELRFPELPSAW